MSKLPTFDFKPAWAAQAVQAVHPYHILVELSTIT
jgi:hypothetical protein